MASLGVRIALTKSDGARWYSSRWTETLLRHFSYQACLLFSTNKFSNECVTIYMTSLGKVKHGCPDLLKGCDVYDHDILAFASQPDFMLLGRCCVIHPYFIEADLRLQWQKHECHASLLCAMLLSCYPQASPTLKSISAA